MVVNANAQSPRGDGLSGFLLRRLGSTASSPPDGPRRVAIVLSRSKSIPWVLTLLLLLLYDDGLYCCAVVVLSV